MAFYLDATGLLSLEATCRTCYRRIHLQGEPLWRNLILGHPSCKAKSGTELRRKVLDYYCLFKH
jgi:hypothetical protein